MATKPVSKSKIIPRQESLLLPEILNPFSYKPPKLTVCDKIQVAVMSVTILPLRLFMIVVCVIIGWVLASIALLGRKKEDQMQPLRGWRNQLRPFIVAACRAVFFIGGFHWVTVKGKRADARSAPILTLAPHSSYMDALPVVFHNLASVVAKSDAALVPFIGTLTRFTQPVFVMREDPDSKRNTIKEIKRRAKMMGTWPQIVIFPEGTCTNRSCLITFKQGAFIPGVPVQPVLMRYLNRYDTVTWTWGGFSAFTLLWLTLCQFNNSLEIEYLPVYTPSAAEKEDPILYGRNVRDVMARALGIPATDHTFEDCRLMKLAQQLQMPMASVLVEFQKLSRKLGVNYTNLEQLLEKFSHVAQENEGQVTLEQFSQLIELPVTKSLKNMFELYDRDDSGTIDFREYVIGLYLIANPANTEETVQFAFQLFDKGAKGYITEPELCEVLYQSFFMEEVDAKRIFAQIEKQNAAHITFNELKAYAKQRPEYAHMFTTFRQEQKECLQPPDSKSNDNNKPSTSSKAKSD